MDRRWQAGTILSPGVALGAAATLCAVKEMRLAFLSAAGAARPLLASAATGERWDGPSALRELTVGALAGHLVGSVLRVEEYLDHRLPDNGEVAISAAAYFASVLDTDDIDAPVHVGIRRRAAEIGSVGQRALVEQFDHSILRLRARLANEPPDRRVPVFGDYVLELDDYLATRVVELTVHTDDLCVSLEHEVPNLPGAVVTITTLVDVARYRHGDLHVLRALSRRERDPTQILRVF